jgi:glycosyltransferase involved in cell wall biosynthesis
MYDYASAIVCASDFIRSKALLRGAPEHKSVVHYIGVDTEEFFPEASVPQSPNVLFVGRLVENKGCEYLLQAMHNVQASFPDCSLTIIGDGPLRASLEQVAAERGLKRTHFLGPQSHDEVKKHLASATIFCVPSVEVASGASEGLGIVFLEAQAMGVPVVSFATGGIPEAVQHGVTGLLAPERDWQGLAANISLLLENRAMWQRFSEAGRTRVCELFDLKKQTAKLETIYDGVIEEWASRHHREPKYMATVNL